MEMDDLVEPHRDGTKIEGKRHGDQHRHASNASQILALATHTRSTLNRQHRIPQ